MDTLWRDIKVAFRSLRKSRAFTLTALVCLALGIGQAGIVFGVLDAVLLKQLPYREADRLVMVWGSFPNRGLDRVGGSEPELIDYQEQVASFSGVDGVYLDAASLSGHGEPVRLLASWASPEVFRTLGVGPAAGRLFGPDDAGDGREPRVVLSHRLWRERFGSDRSLFGRSITLDGIPYTVLGVLPPDFRYGAFETDLWIPMALDLEALLPRRARGLRMVARLTDGVSLETAQAEIDVLASLFEAEYPDVYGPGDGWAVHLVPIRDEVIGDAAPKLFMLAGAVALVLLIACANVANLLLAKAAGLGPEVAIRTALGSGRSRLIRQRLTESLLLAFGGGLLGLGVAYFGTRLFVRLAPLDIPRLHEVAFDGRVLAFTLVVSIVTAVLFGLVPALWASRPDIQSSLKSGGRTSSLGRGGIRLRAALMVAEVAVAVVVLAGTALLVRSFLALDRVDPGFEPQNGLSFELFVSPSRYPEQHRLVGFVGEVTEKLEGLAGIERAAAITTLPLQGRGVVIRTQGVGAVGSGGADASLDESEPELGTVVDCDWRRSSPGYFEAVGTRLLAGRDFTAADRAGESEVAILDRSLAESFWPGEEAVGKEVVLLLPGPQPPRRTVVGIAEPVKMGGLESDALPQVYTPFAQNPYPLVSVVARTAGPPLALAQEVRRTVWDLDSDQPIERLSTLEQVVDTANADRRTYMVLTLGFAVTAVLLAMIGIYGVMAYSVTERSREIGIQMVLGAKQADVLRRFLLRGLVIAGIGLVIGLALALGATRYLESLLFGVTPTDPLALGVALLLLLATALAANLVPALRATRIDPVIALRDE